MPTIIQPIRESDDEKESPSTGQDILSPSLGRTLRFLALASFHGLFGVMTCKTKT
jgi:hypothetical protein